MKNLLINVTVDKVSLIDPVPQVYTGEYNVTQAVFSFSSEWDGLVKKVRFNNVEKTIENNVCIVPMFEKTGSVQIRVYGYREAVVDGDKVIELIYSPEPTQLHVTRGSYDGTVADNKYVPSDDELAPYLNKNELWAGYSAFFNKLENVPENIQQAYDAIDISTLTVSELVASIESVNNMLFGTIADDSVTTTKIADGNITKEKLSQELITQIDNPVASNMLEEWKNQLDASSMINLEQTQASPSDGGINIWTATFADGRTGNFEVRNGSKGDSPVRGIDYWTVEDRMSINEDNLSFITNELASREQLKPEFVTDISECIDSSKLYVLPDGYIYGYLPSESDNNVLPFAVGEDGLIYNGCGYKENTRWSTSGNTDATLNGVCITGYIEVNPGDVVYLKNITMPNNNSSCAVHMFKSIDDTNEGTQNATSLTNYNDAVWDSGNNLSQFTIAKNSSYKFIRIQCTGITEESIVTINEEYANDTKVYSWQKTNHAFVPADYEDRIINLESATQSHESDIITLTASNVKTTADIDKINVELDELKTGKNDTSSVPDYWLEALEEGAQTINTAMLSAGYNKSAFLFYSDSHWDYGSQISPILLKYLYRNTGMTKTIFGGDIVNSEATEYDTMKYLWEWRNMLKDLPNHHSVVGNHDDGNATNNLFNEQYVYGYLLAAEETPDIVRGDSGIYYYIDNPSEKTRYLYLDTAYQGVTSNQIEFIKQALKSTLAGWHIVVISHTWYYPDYSQYSVRPIPIAGMNNNATAVASILDDYNSRSGEFADCGGWVEFCIGGHVHIDYDGATDGGIPIILVETDSKHIRSDLSFTAGTTTEASVNGIIADYDNRKITIVRVGRGTSREIHY